MSKPKSVSADRLRTVVTPVAYVCDCIWCRITRDRGIDAALDEAAKMLTEHIERSAKVTEKVAAFDRKPSESPAE